MKRIRRDPLFFVFSVLFFLFQLPSSCGEAKTRKGELVPVFPVTLDETIRRALETDSRVLQYKNQWYSNEARIEEIRNRGGWTFEIGGRSESSAGDRREFRNTTRGRSSRDIRGRLDEDERFLAFGLSKELLDEKRRKKLDVTEERLSQLDLVRRFFLAASQAARESAQAYLDVYYGSRMEEILESRIRIEQENLRVLNLRAAREEALKADTLESEARVIELRKDLLSIQLQNERQLRFLRELWEIPDLEMEDLASPELGPATACSRLNIRSLIETAFRNRIDLHAMKTAVTTQQDAKRYAKILPEVEVEVTGRVKDFDRDFADEGREDSTLDVRVELGVSVPLSLARRNTARLKQQNYLLRSRAFGLQALRNEIRREVEQAYERHLLSCEQAALEEKRLRQAEENERIVRLTAHTLPESLNGNPETVVREAESKTLVRKLELLRARREQDQALVELQATVGNLTRNIVPPMNLSGGSWK